MWEGTGAASPRLEPLPLKTDGAVELIDWPEIRVYTALHL